MAASNSRRVGKRPAVGWRLYREGRLVLGATSLEALAKCVAIEGARRAAEADNGHPPTVLIDSLDDLDLMFGPLNDGGDRC